MPYPENEKNNSTELLRSSALQNQLRAFFFFIAGLIYRIFRPLLFCFDSETVHDAFLNLLASPHFYENVLVKNTCQILFSVDEACRTPARSAVGPDALILNPRNRIGLAAGFDKNSRALDAFALFGFGFAEVGTVTLRAQEGNPRPRIERIVAKGALLNRMGFPNQGADVIAANVREFKARCKNRHLHQGFYVGVNLGKNKATLAEDAIGEYASLAERFAPIADYLTINLSSPNTPGLRDLQSLEFLSELARALENKKSENPSLVFPPLLIKLSPSFAAAESQAQLKEICAQLKTQTCFSGLILTNTIPTDLGGISGTPLTNPSLDCLRIARTVLPQSYPIISVGGIMTVEDAKVRLNEGASLIQLYSGLIYQPALIGKILTSLR